MSDPDFIVSELLSELKEENSRKDIQIKTLHKYIIELATAAVIAVLLAVVSCFLYLNQYDFTSSDSISIEKTAEGVYAIIDSEGNVIGYDTTEGVSYSGESSSESNTEVDQD